MKGNLVKLKEIPVGGLFCYRDHADEYVCIRSNERDILNGNFYFFAVVVSPHERGTDLRLEERTRVEPLREYLVK